MAAFRSKLSVSVAQVNPRLDTHLLFDATYKESKASPIDEFFIRLISINQLAPNPNAFDPLQGQLVLLGVIAAVESYLRAIFRRVITVDLICQDAVQRRDVSFGAAVHLSREMLPEAILERISFISRASIVDAMKELASIKGTLPSELELAIEDYVRVCQLRHCAVHRFGKLGVANAISLGLINHKELLEKPLKIDYASLQSSIAIVTGFAKTINNHLFNEIISRITPSTWKGVWRDDKKLFTMYYSIFADTVSSVGSTVSSKKLYEQFLLQQAKFASGQSF
jgi:hypothetical protein